MSGEVSDVIKILNKSTAHDLQTLRNALKRLLIFCNEGKDVSSAVGYVVKVLPIQDLVTKKLACVLLTRFKEEIADVGLLVHNTLRQDFYDPNPNVRNLALKTICCCLSQAEDIEEFINLGLKDASAYVRRTAVLNCITLHSRDSDLFFNRGFIDRLYAMLRDPDPVVVSNSLIALDEILRDEGGVVINRNIASYLLGHLTNFTEWGLVQILIFLRRYKPKTEDELFDFLNVLDPLLHSSNSAIVIETAKLFLNLLLEMPHLKENVFMRISPKLASFLSNSTNPELLYLILAFMLENLNNFPNVFNHLYRNLFCKYNENPRIKVVKLQIVTQLTADENVHEIIDEITMHCTSPSKTVSNAAIFAVGQIAKLRPAVFEVCIGKLLQLLTVEQECLTSQVLHVLQSLDLYELKDKSELIGKLQNCRHIVESKDGKCAFWWLIGEYGHLIPEAPHLLEDFISDRSKFGELAVKHAVLIAGLKLFFKRPAECQMVLGRILESFQQDVNGELRDQVHFYYKLLSGDIEVAKKIILGKDVDDHYQTD